MPTIAFVTMCKGRLHHIKQTLPKLLAEKADQTIVVDYGCPDKVGDWVEENHPAATVVRVTDDPEFCSPRARNLGGLAAQAEWLVFIDGDILVKPGWLAWMKEHLEPGKFYRAARINGARDPETYGTCICSRADFEAIGGYDEAFRGWGGDDEDFYRCLQRAGVEETEYPHAFVEAIHHGDEERAGWSGMQSRKEAQIVNECYIAAKAQIETAGAGGLLPLAQRKHILSGTSRALRKWFAEGANQPLNVRYVISRGSDGLPPPFEMETELTVVIRVRQRREQDAA